MNAPVTGQKKPNPTVVNARAKHKYRIDTTSLTDKAMARITGADDKLPPRPTLYFTRKAWVQQCHLVDTCAKEVGWFCLVDHDPETGDFTIDEIVVPKQEVSAAETNIGAEEMGAAAEKLIEEGKDTSRMYAWFHSHVNMSVTPSGQDEAQVEEYLEELQDQTAVPAFIRGIQNKKGALKVDVYFMHHGIIHPNIEVKVLYNDDPEWRTEIDELVKTNVKERIYSPPAPYYGNHTHGYGSGSNYDDDYDNYGASSKKTARSAGPGVDFTDDDSWEAWAARQNENSARYIEAWEELDRVSNFIRPIKNVNVNDMIVVFENEYLEVFEDIGKDNTPIWYVCIGQNDDRIYPYDEFESLYDEFLTA